MNTRDKKLNFKNWKLWSIILAALLAIGYFVNSRSGSPQDLTTKKVSTMDSEPIIIYAKNETINKFLITYNTINKSDKIDSKMFKPYYHHGSIHENQIIFENKSGFEIVITATFSKIKIVIKPAPGITQKNEEEYKSEFIKFVKAFDETINDQIVNSSWQKIITSSLNGGVIFEKFEKFEASLTSYGTDHNQNIEMLVIEQK